MTDILSKEEREVVESNRRFYGDKNRVKCPPTKDVFTLVSLIDHLEGRVMELQSTSYADDFNHTHEEKKKLQSQLDQLTAEKIEATKYVDEEIVKAAGLNEAVKVLRHEYNQLREVCGPIVEKLEQHDSVIKKMGGRAQDDTQWYTDIPLPIARRISELVKGGMGFENI